MRDLPIRSRARLPAVGSVLVIRRRVVFDRPTVSPGPVARVGVAGVVPHVRCPDAEVVPLADHVLGVIAVVGDIQRERRAAQSVLSTIKVKDLDARSRSSLRSEYSPAGCGYPAQL